MAAVKAIRSIRKWSYETFGNEKAIAFTVMCTPEDLSVNAEYIRMADSYVQVPGGPSHQNYSNVDLIVDIAHRTGVHAVYLLTRCGLAGDSRPKIQSCLTSSMNSRLK
jgi:acetyl-CoA carboxylase/biotin carboxylase 1